MIVFLKNITTTNSCLEIDDVANWSEFKLKNFHDIIVFWLILNSLETDIFFSNFFDEAKNFVDETSFFCFENETKFSNSRSERRLIILSITFSYSFTSFMTLSNFDKLLQTSCSESYFFQRIKYSTSRTVFRLLKMFFNSNDLINDVSFSM